MGKEALSCCDIPDDLIDLVVFELVKDAIGTYQNVVQVVNTALLECCLWITGHDSLEPTKASQFSLAIAKSAAN